MKSFHQAEQNPQWKGKKAKYMAFHNWARRHFGKPSYCEMCGIEDIKKMYHWCAVNKNKGGRERKDWKRLCVKCHSIYDGRTGGKKIFSETHIKHLSESHLGLPGYWLGKKRDSITIKKISDTLKKMK